MSGPSTFIEHHNFFVRESPKMVTMLNHAFKDELPDFCYIEYQLKDLIYWPIAYVKFMWLSRNEFL